MFLFKQCSVFTYLLLHLANLEFVVAQLAVVDFLAFVPVLLGDNLLYLPDERPASRRDSLGCTLEPVLRLAHEAGLDTTGSHQLSGGSSDVVGSDNELLRRVATGDDTVGGLDEHVCRCGDGLGSTDETFGPAVVLLVELRLGHASSAFANNFFLRFCRCLDELSNRIRDGDGCFEDGVVDLELVG